jgi:hypothetical protein
MYSLGDEQGVNPAPSSEHWKVAAGSLDSKVNAAVGLAVVASGWEVMVAVGAVRWPLVHSCSEGVWSALPSGPTARTSNVCSP